MRSYITEQTILDAIGILTADFTAAVATDLLTSAAHGLKDGDMVVLTTTDTLPAGLAVLTIYHVRDASTNTFRLAATNNGVPIDITDTGTGTHTFTMHDIGRSILVEDFRHAIISFDTANSASVVTKFQGSIQDSAPDFSAAQSITNRWDYIQIKDLEDASAVDGDTGITLSGSDDHRAFELNVNHLKWVNVILSTWVAGDVTVKIKLSSD